MKTKAQVKRATHELDAAGVPLGRLASRAAILLLGKHKVEWEHNTDCGDFVRVKNAGKVVLTGKKMEQKEYKHFSGYPGGLKSRLAKDVLAKNPAWMVKNAVVHMLPNNRLRDARIKRLTFSK